MGFVNPLPVGYKELIDALYAMNLYGDPLMPDRQLSLHTQVLYAAADLLELNGLSVLTPQEIKILADKLRGNKKNE